MILSKNKPYVIRFAEIIYKEIVNIKIKYPNLETKNAIDKFIETETFNELSTGRLHNEWFEKLKKNNNIDDETEQQIPLETIKLLKIQRDAMIEQLTKVPKLYETKNNTLIDASNRANQFLWRMCESYELWCKETGQSEQLLLNITD